MKKGQKFKTPRLFVKNINENAFDMTEIKIRR
jgi:hypothetical protein